jgi:hypothetical protein
VNFALICLLFLVKQQDKRFFPKYKIYPSQNIILEHDIDVKEIAITQIKQAA